MSWEKLIISGKSSKDIKDTIQNLNDIDGFEGKYIGVIPIYWDTLGIYKNNLKSNGFENIINKIVNNQFQSNKINNLSNSSLIDKMKKLNINEDNPIQEIYTFRKNILIAREFYYLSNNKDETYFPIYRYDDKLTFTIREIKKHICIWLLKEGFNIKGDNFDIFRIYKMNGFHLFGVILPLKTDKLRFTNNLNLKSNNSIKNNLIWKSDYGLELLPLNDIEIINPFMKIIQLKQGFKDKNMSISSIWFKKLQGLFININNSNHKIPFNIKWEELLATLANLIDLEANQNLHLYFKCNFLDNSSMCVS